MRRILLVDDNEQARSVLGRRLARRGFEVVPAADGAAAVALARSAAPDLVIMDLGMPVMDGWEATARIKADPDTRHLPVIALTAFSLEQDRRRALAAGCDAFETKPVDFARLVERIYEHLPAASP